MAKIRVTCVVVNNSEGVVDTVYAFTGSNGVKKSEKKFLELCSFDKNFELERDGPIVLDEGTYEVTQRSPDDHFGKHTVCLTNAI